MRHGLKLYFAELVFFPICSSGFLQCVLILVHIDYLLCKYTQKVLPGQERKGLREEELLFLRFQPGGGRLSGDSGKDAVESGGAGEAGLGEL